MNPTIPFALSPPPVSPMPVHLPPRECGCGSHGASAIHWHVVQTKPGEEFRALRELSQPRMPNQRPAGFQAYLPTEVVRREHKVQGVTQRDRDGRVIRKEHVVPFFRGYLFTLFDQDAPGWGPILSTQGVSRLLCTSFGRPAVVPAAFVDELRARGRPGDGAIDREYHGPSFPTGSTVSVTDGPFWSHRAIVEMSDVDRVHVLLSIFGRATRVTLDKTQVAAV